MKKFCFKINKLNELITYGLRSDNTGREEYGCCLKGGNAALKLQLGIKFV